MTPKRARMDVSEFQNELLDQTNRNIPQELVRLMYQLDLSILCSLRKFTHQHKYPSLSLAFGDCEIDKFSDIVLSCKDKSTHVQIKYVDQCYIDNDISYAALFGREKEKRSFFINDYFNSFVKYIINNPTLNNMEYLIIYTNSGLGLTEEKKLKKGRSRNFYPFQFERMENCDILRDFFGGNFYQFSRDKTIKEKLINRLEFSSALQKILNERKFTPQFEKEVKEKFVDKLVFAVNQPNREELKNMIKSEILNKIIEYDALEHKILHDLTRRNEDYTIVYEFSLLMLLLHEMYFHRNIFFVNFKSGDKGNNIVINHKGRIIYVKAHNANRNIDYSHIFRSSKQRRKNKFSINGHFIHFMEELEKDDNIQYFIIYNSTGLDLTKEKRLKKGQSKDFHPLKFESIDDIENNKYKVLRDCSFIDKNGLYRFSQEERTKFSSLFQRRKEERRSDKNERELKEKFLDKLIFAVNQPNREELKSILKNEIEKNNKVPYNYEELHEIALRWSESHELGAITKEIMEKLLEDIKNNRSSYEEIPNKSIEEEIKFARSVVGGEGTSTFCQFLRFLIKGEGMKYLHVLKENGINLSSMSSILNKAGVAATKAFKDLYDLWFDEEGNRTDYLNTLDKEGMNISNMSSILNKAGANAAKAFKDLYDLWFDGEGNRTHYLNTLMKKGINLCNMSSILNGTGVKASKAFITLYDTFFNEQGNEKPHLKHFIEKKEGEKSFTLDNLSGILSGAGANAKDAFEKLHDVCFDDEGKRTQLLDDFYKADFKPRNLSCVLCGAGVRASFILKRLHSICFDDEGKRTQLFDDFYEAGFRPCDLCGILSGAVNSLEKFHNFCFIEETKKYFHHFLKEGFTPKNLSKILHGAKANICSALKDFHDICFDDIGNKTKILNDFYEARFTPNDLSNILSMAGNNAAYILKNFHECCFNEDNNYLNHFLAGEKLFTPKDLYRILYGVGTNICPIFRKLHHLCFDEAGNKTSYLNDLIQHQPPCEILNILHEKIRKASR